MTILNTANYGVYSDLINVFRLVLKSGAIDSGAILKVCQLSEGSGSRGVLGAWTQMGLFSERNGKITVAKNFVGGKDESPDDMTVKLPDICRGLLLDGNREGPLWNDSPSIGTDFVKGCAWLLAQDVHGFPTSYPGVDKLVSNQMTESARGNFLSNSVPWNGLRLWMSYLGFATGSESSWQIDPTLAIKSVLPLVFKRESKMLAKKFLSEVASILPVLDSGNYRLEVESQLNKNVWKKEGRGRLSSSLSLALKRLELDNVLKLRAGADAGNSYVLTGLNNQSAGAFEGLEWSGDIS